MTIRAAIPADIAAIQRVRHSVLENRLSDPGLVTDADCHEFLVNRGKGWVAESANRIVGFAIADLQGRNIWALFLEPASERQGIGRQLHDTMLDWYFAQTMDTVWLSTAPATRAADFYRAAGWTEAGAHGAELRFEMSYQTSSERRAGRGM